MALTYLLTAILAYVLGSIPTGYIVARVKGLDIRNVGSGNIGATNVFRTLGKPAGIFVLVVDGLKGYAAAAWMVDLIQARIANPAVEIEHLRLVAGLCVVLGHNYTFWLKFKGGKGIATSAGALAAMVPWALVVILSIFIIVLAATRYVSLGSICASLALPFATWITGGQHFLEHGSLTMISVTTAMGILAIYKHRANIRRLIEGTESRLGVRPKEAVQ
ncbi:MAG TPA: glycerol-3-phosphate 1-O-acyltransferase PlsY [Verrucomicrobiae bacterium]